ncbi:SUKH-3 domain-containing protein [Hamadaea sp. NPDC050747]|uniref:SUKH-3 domain-containing protein n=1 Tax=Hamadaea sp. NPDC050747 TaxID=3155789 RepID=UPI0033E9049F
MTDLMPDTQVALRAAGWFRGRVVETAEWNRALLEDGFGEMHPAARSFLTEFGAICVDHAGPGVTSAREPFDLDPLLCLGEADRFLAWSEVVGRSIYPVGDLDDRYLLGLDEDSTLYLVATWLATFGRLPQALDALVLGYAPKDVA